MFLFYDMTSVQEPDQITPVSLSYGITPLPSVPSPILSTQHSTTSSCSTFLICPNSLSSRHPYAMSKNFFLKVSSSLCPLHSFHTHHSVRVLWSVHPLSQRHSSVSGGMAGWWWCGALCQPLPLPLQSVDAFCNTN